MNIFKKCDDYTAPRALRDSDLYTYFRCISSAQDPVVTMDDKKVVSENDGVEICEEDLTFDQTWTPDRIAPMIRASLGL